MDRPTPEFGFSDEPNTGRFYHWLVGLGCLIVVLLCFHFGAFIFKHGHTDVLADHSDEDCETYDRHYGSVIVLPNKNGKTSMACQYDSVTQEFLGCGSCKEADRQALLVEARRLKEHGAGWRRADISYATTICPIDRDEVLVKLPGSNFYVVCHWGRAVRIVLESSTCVGRAAEPGQPIETHGLNLN